MTMLIVDDSAKVRTMLKKLFHHNASAIYECGDGADALSLYSAYHPDWVLMDVKMKRLDGVAATRAIKHDYPDAKIIIVTQYDDPLSRQEALEAGALEYVLKDNMFLLPDIMKSLQ